MQGTPQKPVNCILYKAKEHEGSLSSLCLNKVRMYICVCVRPLQCPQWYWPLAYVWLCFRVL